MRAFALLFALLPAAVSAQGEPAPDSARTSDVGAGIALSLTNDGFGLGAFARGPLTRDLAWTLGLSGRPGKDEREQQFFVGLFGDTVIPFKRSHFLLFPLEAGVERRLFRDRIKPTFRPFVHAAAGPVIGYQWPYFEDLDGDGRLDEEEAIPGTFGLLDEGEFRLGVGGHLSVGAYVDTSVQSALGVRFGYAAAYFFEEVDLLEQDPLVEDPSRRFFGTPTLGVQFVRRFGGG